MGHDIIQRAGDNFIYGDTDAYAFKPEYIERLIKNEPEYCAKMFGDQLG